MANDLSKQIELVFEIDREQNPTRFKNEKMKLVEYLYLYVLEKYKYNRTLLYNGNYEEYALEIVNTGLYCIDNYNPEHESKASFLTYFIASWELECARIRGKEALDKGVSIPERDKRLLNQLVRYLQSRNIVFSPTLHRELVAEVLGVSDEKAVDIIYLYFLKTETIMLNEDGEEISLIDSIRDNKCTQEEVELRKVSWEELMRRIEKGFKALKKSPQQYIYDVITCDIAGVLSYYNEAFSYNYSFINIRLMNEILCSGKILKAKDIAEIHNTSPQTISRAYSRAMKNIWDNMNETRESSEIGC